eukprot:CAMPEP_0167806728 /NCGR_PEP_ID=MMETSP0111_2-20121227/22036_1 /TAXON_ID=91324 /ORGANISM="Lotharella globosa, Strain CCCM811" /LENGTH=101 /DNA_ID=CAMNT_0007704307 /DNA_START=504 /DNA_END=807 /DNA_ORIENTATION=+
MANEINAPQIKELVNSHEEKFLFAHNEPICSQASHTAKEGCSGGYRYTAPDNAPDNYPAINFSAFLTRGVPQHHRKHPHESQAEDKIDQSQEDQQVHRSGF